MGKWVPTWRCVPIDYNQDVGVLENITQKCVFTNNIAGEKLRLRFQNLYSDRPMVIDHAAVALHNRESGSVSKRYPVTYRGQAQIVIPAGECPYSDELELRITAQDDLLVFLYFGQSSVLRSVCTTSAAVGWQSVHQTGDFSQTDALGFTIREKLVPVLAHDPYPLQFAAGICEAAVLAEDDVKLIALFGDSVTHMSLFMDPLLERLRERFPGQYAVINAGISGNRIQKDYPLCKGFPGEGHQFGVAGRKRFLTDVYDGAQPDIVFVLEGVNDCSHSLCFREPTVPTAEDIFQALEEVVAMGRARGSRVYVGTIPPFGAFGEPWREAAEKTRCAYNALIRTASSADGVVDMDAALRDPGAPQRMQEGFHLGDGVHPNWHGGSRMAETLLKALFGSC